MVISTVSGVTKNRIDYVLGCIQGLTYSFNSDKSEFSIDTNLGCNAVTTTGCQVAEILKVIDAETLKEMIEESLISPNHSLGLYSVYWVAVGSKIPGLAELFLDSIFRENYFLNGTTW